MSESPTPPAPDRLDLDDLLAEVGHFGRFQLWQCALLLLPVVFTAFSNLCYVFTAGDVHYRCHVPECEQTVRADAYAYTPDWLKHAVPFGVGSELPAKCDRYRVLPSENDTTTCNESRFNHSIVDRCSEFVFEDPTERTIVNDFHLTCDENRWKVTLVGTVHSIGQFVSLALSGIISDRFGRRWTLLLGVGVGAALAIVRSFTTSYGAFMTLEFTEAMFGSTSYTTAFILSLELVEPRLRVIVKSVILVAYALAEALLGLLAMTFRDWRTLSIVLFVPGVISISLLYTTAESVRWLLAKDRQQDVVAILQRVAKANGRPPLPQSTLDEFYLQQKAKLEADRDEAGRGKSFMQLLRETCQHRRLLLRIANCAFCWFTNAMVYYGLTLNSVTLAGDKYSNFIFITLAEIPPSLAINCILNRFGRRKTQCGSLVLSGLFCLLALTALKDIAWLNVGLFLMSKMAISLSFSTLYIYTAEIFPTNLRQSFISFCSMVGRFGSMLAPQMPLLQALWTPLPMLLFGSVAVLSGVLILEFPETTGVTLPNTLEEAIELHSRRKQPPVEPEKGSYTSPG
ncbi:solute carrier family 22 member 4-like [Anopheles nili]|uniref:solute carrier family 22 member 4-like n=1 Tax=Anopheles nili TaxID=185578 RepID=UPI00237ADBD0|nr:solute carrier family 22 member 4-like [Anopheles nili]